MTPVFCVLKEANVYNSTPNKYANEIPEIRKQFNYF